MNTDPPPELVSTDDRATTSSQIRVWAVIRDVVLVWLLTVIGGFMVGHTGAQHLLLVLAGTMIPGVIGFVFSGCWAKGNRWRHLVFVAGGMWLTGLINVFCFGLSLTGWLLTLIPGIIIMGIGGALSYVFKKP